MKTTTLLQVLVLLSLVLGIQILHAQNVPTVLDQSEPVLSGSGLKLADAVSRADTILTGTLLDLGVKSFKSDGVLNYYHTKITPLTVLKGAFDSAKGIKMSRMTSAKEESPTSGQEYIFFLKMKGEQEPSVYDVIKLLTATDANVTKVKALIAAAPAAK